MGARAACRSGPRRPSIVNLSPSGRPRGPKGLSEGLLFGPSLWRESARRFARKRANRLKSGRAGGIENDRGEANDKVEAGEMAGRDTASHPACEAAQTDRVRPMVQAGMASRSGNKQLA